MFYYNVVGFFVMNVRVKTVIYDQEYAVCADRGVGANYKPSCVWIELAVRRKALHAVCGLSFAYGRRHLVRASPPAGAYHCGYVYPYGRAVVGWDPEGCATTKQGGCYHDKHRQTPLAHGIRSALVMAPLAAQQKASGLCVNTVQSRSETLPIHRGG